ncbi:MAG: oxidoreductase [Planctomycetaceae bacterium]|jgi:predicted dehydrogenase|nr:oxidoreductase [Planctomycetaceae bacterium]|tara:strand:+ start:18 stop:1337 length:1320 start_codon:yes stop_codon:yes gene_type:complete
MSKQSAKLNRRSFVSALGVTAIGSGVFVNPTPAQESTSPNERLNLAAIGVTGRAAGNIKGVATQNLIAMVDIDSKLLETGSQAFPNARKYNDFRVMLEKEAEKIDGVVVSTPDHTHAPAAAMALRLKKHVYCEKPLTHTVYEARTLANLAAENNLKTQMGTQIHAGDNYRRVVELVQSGAIGKIDRVHVWAGAVYTGAKFVKAEKPDNVNWDLWLGPAPERHYCADIHPFKWRSFWDYGRGSLGDFGCHYMDLAHWALQLQNPERVKAQGPEVDSVSTPAWCIVDYHYPARRKQPPVHLTWYDSGKRPELLNGLKDLQGNPIAPWGGGQLFIGSKGMILSNYSSHMVLVDGQQVEHQAPDPWIPKSIGHHNEWLQAIKEDGETTCNFDYSGGLTESVLLGTVAYQSGVELEWNSKKLQVTNSKEAQNLIHKEYRKGWEL